MSDLPPIVQKYGVDTTDFKTGLAAMNRELRVLESSFRATAAGLSDWAKDASGLEARVKSLNKQIDVQRDKVTVLRAEYERVAAAKGKNSQAAKELEIRLNKEVATLNKMETELGQTEQALGELGKESREAGKGAEQLSRAEQTAERSTGRLKAAIDRLKGGLKSVAGEFRNLGDKVLRGLAVGIAGVTAAAAGLAVGVGAALSKAIPAASDLNETINKVNVVFEDAGAEIIKFSQTAATALGQSQQQALDAASTFGIFGKAAGLTGGDLSDFSLTLTGLASDLASFNNATPQEVIEALGAALRGEAEPMRRFGVLLDDATLRQKALELGLVKTTTEALTPQQKVLAAYNVILEQTTDAQGDFARTSDGLANSQRIVQALWADLVATLGKIFLPIAEEVMRFLSTTVLPVLADFAKYIGLVVEEGDTLNDFLEKLPGWLQPIAESVGDVIVAFQEFVGFLQNNQDPIAALVRLVYDLSLALGASEDNAFQIADQFYDLLTTIQELAATIRTFIDEHLEELKGALVGIGTALAASGLVAILAGLANPINLLIILAGLLGAAWAGNWGGIQQKTEEVIGAIQPIIEGLANAVQTIITGDFTGGIFGLTEDHPAIGALLAMHDAFEGIRNALANIDWEGIGETIGNVWGTIQEVVGAVVDTIVQEAWPEITAAFEEIRRILAESGVDWEGLKTAITIAVGVIAAVVVGLIAVITGVAVGIARAVATIVGHFESVRAKSQQIWANIGEILQNAADLFDALVHGDWAEAWDLFTENVGLAFDTIKTFVSTFAEIIFANFDAVMSFIDGFVSSVIGFFENLYERLVGGSIVPDLVDGILGYFQDLIDQGTEIWENLVETVIGFVQQIYDDALAIAGDFPAIGTAIVQGIIDGLSAAWGGLQGIFNELVGRLPQWAQDLLGISSPSKVFEEIGRAIGEGLIAGIESQFDAIEDTMQELGLKILEVGGKLGGIGSGFASQYQRQVLDPIGKRVQAAEARLSMQLGEVRDLLSFLGIEWDDFSAAGIQRLIRLFPTVAPGVLPGVPIRELERLHELTLALGGAQEKYNAAQQRTLALQEAQADLAFLKSQMDLLQLIKEFGLDAKDILGGLVLGLQADAGALVDAMVRAMQAMIEGAEAELGIASPAKATVPIGRNLMAGVLVGIEAMMARVSSAFAGSLAGLGGIGGLSLAPAAAGSQSNVYHNERIFNVTAPASLQSGERPFADQVRFLEMLS